MKSTPRNLASRRTVIAGVLSLAGLGAIAAALALVTFGGSSDAAIGEVDAPAASVVSEASAARGGPDDFGWRTLIVPTEGWKTDFTKHTVPLIQFVSAGPGRDGIPPIDDPVYVSVSEADPWLADGEPILRVELDGDVRGYPIQVLIWHEIVNTELGGRPIVVTFCPLCNTALAFEREADGQVLDFGSTGNLNSNDLVMYDRQTESWWQQFGGAAVVGELSGTELVQVPSTILAWNDFKAAHPAASVLSRDTGFDRPYGGRPYGGYDELGSPTVVGSKNTTDDRVPRKERVVFVERGDESIAIPFSALEAAGVMKVEVAEDLLEVTWLPDVLSPFGSADHPDGKEVGSAEVRLVETGEIVAFDTPFWFAVAAFRSDVQVVRP